MRGLNQLRIKLFCDAADFSSLLAWAADPRIQGFTTSPTLMRRASVIDYEAFARQLLKAITDRPVSLEVLADDPDTIEEQALAISEWGANVYVKIPVTNTWGVSTGPILRRLSYAGVKLNVTALFTLQQVEQVASCLDSSTPAILSVFAGRIADTGVDPLSLVRRAVRTIAESPNLELLWASSHELLNIFHAEDVGCHIIALMPEILNKLDLIGKNLEEFSLETVNMLHRDALACGYRIDIRRQTEALTA